MSFVELKDDPQVGELKFVRNSNGCDYDECCDRCDCGDPGTGSDKCHCED